MSAATRIPLVDYLVLTDPPYLVAKQCTACSARFFDRRSACAACGSDVGFDDVAVERDGVVRTFTVVAFAAPGVPVPFVAAVVDCGGTSVRGNLVNIEPRHVELGMRVRLTTVPAGVDSVGTEAVAYAFEPISNGAV